MSGCYTDPQSETEYSNRMFVLRSEYAVVLFFALTKSLVFGSLEDETRGTQGLSKGMVDSLESSWIHGLDAFTRSTDSEACANEVSAVLQAFSANETGLLQMVDASSKLQSGILKGNVRDLGMYSECVEINQVYNNVTVQGKHCMVSIGMASSPAFRGIMPSSGGFGFTSAVCVPKSCTEAEVIEILNSTIRNLSQIVDPGISVNGASCARVDPEDFTLGEILTLIFFATVAGVIVLCTVCDILRRCNPTIASFALNEISKFSLYTNALALLSTKVNPQTMPAIQGIRFLSMCWVVLGHRYVTTLVRPVYNLVDIFAWNNSWVAVYVQAATFAVDTFFVISGFLMAYLFLKARKSGKNFNVLTMYIHRYLRLTPSLAAVMLFTAVLLHRVANGPLWASSIVFLTSPCEKNWWVNLLYLQNIVREAETCLPHTWYLAVDMQLFWISPFILYSVYRWPKYGIGLLGVFLIASVITPVIVLAVNGYTNALVRFDTDDVSKIMDGFNNYYKPTYNRACAYFLGVVLGYEVANKKRDLGRAQVAFGWILTCFLALFCGWATHRAYDTTHPYNKTMEIMFAILLRPSWSVSMAWIVYATTQGYGGIVTRFLSAPIFLPLSRLTYCIYLVHIVIQITRNSATETVTLFKDFELFSEVWSDLALSIPIAFALSLFFESPVVVLEKMLSNRGRKAERASLMQESKEDLEQGIQNTAMPPED